MPDEGSAWWKPFMRIEALLSFIGMVLPMIGGAFEGVPWTIRIPMGMLVAYVLVRAWDLYGGRISPSLGIAGPPSTPKFHKSKQAEIEPRPVAFTVLGKGSAAPFQIEITATSDAQSWESELLVLRVEAKKNLKNASIKFEVEEAGTCRVVLVARYNNAFIGNIANSTREDIQLMKREYVSIVPPSETPAEAYDRPKRLRQDRRVILLPDADKTCDGKVGRLYRFLVTVLHDEGPDICRLMINVSEIDQSLSRLVEAIGDVEISNEYKSVPGRYWLD